MWNTDTISNSGLVCLGKSYRSANACMLDKSFTQAIENLNALHKELSEQIPNATQFIFHYESGYDGDEDWLALTAYREPTRKELAVYNKRKQSEALRVEQQERQLLSTLKAKYNE